jgi:hypothetical protein
MAPRRWYDMASPYSASSTKERRTSQDVEELLRGTLAVLNAEREYGPMTIRHCYYKLVEHDLLDKTEQEYDNLGYQLRKWRRSGDIPYSAFADNSRIYYQASQFNCIEDALRNTRDTYRRNLWASQSEYVEIWVEKDAVAHIVFRIASQFGVRVFPTHGFNSITAAYNSSETFKRAQQAGKNVHVYYFGDFDKAGKDISNSITRNLKNDHHIDIDFQRVAINEEQVVFYNLPTRPPKPRDIKQGFVSCVEIDALPMKALTKLIEDCIIQHIDPLVWERQQEIEDHERQTIDFLVDHFNDIAEGVA